MTKDKDIKTVVPALRFPEFRDAEGWKMLYGSKVFEQISNKNHNSDLPILAISQEYGAIPRDMIDYNVVVTDKSIESYKVVDIDDFIISLRSFQGGIEYSSYRGICSPAYIILRKKINLNNQFFKHYFKSYMFIQDLNKNLEGIRDGKMVSYKQFSEILLPVPTPNEQSKIADCFGSLDDLISAVADKIEALKEHKKGLMQQLFPADGKTTPVLRFPEFQNAGEWIDVKIKDVISAITTGKLDANAMVENGKYRFYTCAKNYYFINDYAFDTEAILIAGNGAYLGYIHHYTGKFNAYQRTYVLSQFDTKIDVSFFRYYLEINLPSRIESEKKDGNTPYIVLSTITEMEVLFPNNINEQKKIADCLSLVDDLISAETDKLDQLKAHKKGLMQQLFPTINK